MVRTFKSSRIKTINRRPRLTTLNVHNPVGRKRTRTLVAESRARSSRCCGLSSVVYHGWEGKKRGHSNWRKLLWRSVSLTGKVNKLN